MPKGYSAYNQGGWNHSKTSLSKMREAKVGKYKDEGNPRWVGGKVSYPALHNWVRSHFKRPTCCEVCGRRNKLNKRGHSWLQWANRTKKYLRDRKDWMCLCPKCHKELDNKIKVKHRYGK